MNQISTRPDPDAVKRALEVLGDRWTFLILREAFFGVHRYGYFQRNLGIGRNVLAARLSALVEHGLLEARGLAYLPSHESRSLDRRRRLYR